jgi:hypothetical protein
MDTGDTRSVDVLEVISDHNTYKILKLVSMKQDGYAILTNSFLNATLILGSIIFAMEIPVASNNIPI